MSTGDLWAVLGGMTVIVGGQATLIILVVNAKIDGLRNELKAEISGLRREVLALTGHPEPEPEEAS